MTAAARSTHIEAIEELIRLALDSRLAELHVCMPGKVVAYDATTQTATIQPGIRRPGITVDSELVHDDLPDFFNVPICFPGADVVTFTWPIAVGSYVLLVFADSDVSQWRETGQPSNVDNLRRHGLSNAFAIPMGRPNSSPISSAQKNAIVITGAEVRLATDSDTADMVLLAQDALTFANQVKTAIIQIASALNNPGPVVGAPGTVVPVTTLPAAATKVRAV